MSTEKKTQTNEIELSEQLKMHKYKCAAALIPTSGVVPYSDTSYDIS